MWERIRSGLLDGPGPQRKTWHFSNYIITLGASLLAQLLKESACNAGDPGLIRGSGRSPGEGHGSPLLYSCLEHSMDRGVWRVIVHGVAKSQALLSGKQTLSLRISREHIYTSNFI